MELDATQAADHGDATVPMAPHERPSTLPRGTAIGRFLLLGQLGAGGMGVVYAAHDPDLDRRVALKLVTRSDDLSRDRLLREAQALARLAHPNVVTVHDVGTHASTVWIAMELVDGLTLGAWARKTPRSPAAILRTLVEAARGVAAAHAAGLVHRDLKPDNVMVGHDGRVRVMDFGLAHGRSEAGPRDRSQHSHLAESSAPAALSLQLSSPGALQGTPAYMAPEQWEGREAGTAADQFGWCVMAWELLHGERPFHGADLFDLADAVRSGKRRPPPRRRRAPAWLRRVLERGLATQPAQRWPSMNDLLAALRRARARARLSRALIAVAVLALLALAALALHRRDRAQTLAACITAGAEIDTTWNDDARQRITAALQTTGLRDAAATAERVMPWLDQQAAAWRRTRGLACLESELHLRWDSTTRDAALACLEDRRLAIASLIDELARADQRVAPRAVAAAAALPPIEPCGDRERLRRYIAPPGEHHDATRSIRRELARADSLRLAGKYSDGLTAARDAHTAAEALAWPPLTATANLALARLLHDTGSYADAETRSADVFFSAAPLAAWELAADAAILLTHLAGNRRGDLPDGTLWARNAELAIHEAGDRLGLRESNRLNSLANAHGAARRYPEARALHERTLEIRRRLLGPDHPDVAWALNNLALDHASLGELATARTLHDEALAIRRRVLGPEHPDVAASLFNLATLERRAGNLDTALALHRRALEIRERALGPEHPDVAHSLNNLALVHYTRGEHTAARPLLARAVAIREKTLGPTHPDLAASLDNLGLVRAAQSAHADAAALHQRALEIREQSLGPDHLDVARNLHNLGRARLRMHDPAAAEPLQQRALAIALAKEPNSAMPALAHIELALIRLARGAPDEALPLLERALGELPPATRDGSIDEAVARFALARTLAATDPARALAEATQARARRPRTPNPDLADLDAWIAAHQPR